MSTMPFEAAKDWTEEDNVWTFHLKNDVYFSGEQLTLRSKWTTTSWIVYVLLHASGFVSMSARMIYSGLPAKTPAGHAVSDCSDSAGTQSGAAWKMYSVRTDRTDRLRSVYLQPGKKRQRQYPFVRMRNMGRCSGNDVLVYRYDNAVHRSALKLGEVDAHILWKRRSWMR